MECFLELKSISQALVTLGPEEFFKLISPNALIGSEKGQEILLGAHFDEALNKLFTDIKNKKFYKETEVNHGELRSKILKRWKHEHMNETFNKLKSELI
jgi:ketol-acid reductoisomerase